MKNKFRSRNLKSLPFSASEVNDIKEHLGLRERDACSTRLFDDAAAIWMDAVLEADTVSLQLQLLQKARSLLNINGEAKHQRNIFQFLVTLVIRAPLRHPVQRATMSILMEMGSVHALVLDEVHAGFEALLLDTHSPSSCLETFGTQRQQTAGVILAFLDNFPSGQEAVSRSFPRVIDFFAQSLGTLLEQWSAGGNSCAVDILSLLKSFVVCKDINLTTQDTAMQTSFKLIQSAMCDILTNDTFPFDCRVAAGLGYFNCKNFNMHIGTETICTPDVHVRNLDSGWTSSFMSKFPDIKFGQLTDEPVVQLILCHGMLVASDDFQFQTQNNLHDLSNGGAAFLNKRRIPFVNILLRLLVDLCDKTLGKPATVFLMKCHQLWASAFSSKLQQEEFFTDFMSLYDSNGYMDCIALPILSRFLCHAIDAVRYQASSALKLHYRAIRLHPCSRSIFTRIIDVNINGQLHSRDKLLMLQCLLEDASERDLFQGRPELTSQLVCSLSDVTLVPFATDVFVKLVGKGDVRQCASIRQPLEHCNAMGESCIRLLLAEITGSRKSESRSIIVSCVISRLTKENESVVKYILSYMDEKVRGRNMEVEDTIALYKIINDASRTKHTKSSGATPCQDVIPSIVIKSALVHSSEQVRFDALSLLLRAATVGNGTWLKVADLDMIEFFLRYNLAVSSPSCRDHLVTVIRKMFAEVVAAIITDTMAANHDTVANSLTSRCSAFLQWIFDFLLSNVTPSHPYSVKLTALYLLTMMVTTINERAIPDSSTTSTVAVRLKSHFSIKSVHLLITCLYDAYSDVRTAAVRLLKCLSESVSHCRDVMATYCVSEIDTLCQSLKPDDVSTAGHLASLVALIGVQPPLPQLGDVSMQECVCPVSVTQQTTSTHILFMKHFLGSVTTQLKQAEKSLVDAIVECPIYGTLHCLVSYLSVVTSSTSEHSQWKALIRDLIDVCCRIYNVVKPYLSSDSPEGSLACDNDAADNLSENVSVLDVGESATLSQRLLVCCWRCAKEICSLFGVIVSKREHQSSAAVLEIREISKMVDVFKDILLNVKHMGAFELASEGFKEVCTTLWRSEQYDHCSLPKDWLVKCTHQLTSSEGNEEVCITRRGAGIPYFLKAICITEPKESNFSCLKLLVTEILQFCSRFQLQSSPSLQGIGQQIAGLNILRHIFLDSKLGEHSLVFVEDGLILSINGFQSTLWAIRNSSTLLFSTLVKRVFSVSSPIMTGREFFARYPLLFEFLLSQLSSGKEPRLSAQSAPSVQFSLFPVLTILGKLRPSSLDAVDSSVNLQRFVAPVRWCLGSRLWKMRTLAASALTSLTFAPNEDLSTMLIGIIELIPVEPSRNVVHQNEIHGLLLHMTEVVQNMAVGSRGAAPCTLNSAKVNKLVQALLSRSWLIERNPCYVTVEAFFKLIDCILHHFRDQGFQQQEPLPSISKLASWQFSFLCKLLLCVDTAAIIPSSKCIALEHCMRSCCTVVLSYCRDDGLANGNRLIQLQPDACVETWFKLLTHSSKDVWTVAAREFLANPAKVITWPMYCQQAFVEKLGSLLGSDVQPSISMLEALASLCRLLCDSRPWSERQGLPNTMTSPHMIWSYLKSSCSHLFQSDRARSYVHLMLDTLLPWAKHCDDSEVIDEAVLFFLDSVLPWRDEFCRQSVASLLACGNLSRCLEEFEHAKVPFWLMVVQLLQDQDHDTTVIVSKAVCAGVLKTIKDDDADLIDESSAASLMPVFVLRKIIRNIQLISRMGREECFAFLLQLVVAPSAVLAHRKGHKHQELSNGKVNSSMFETSSPDANVDLLATSRLAYEVLTSLYVDERRLSMESIAVHCDFASLLATASRDLGVASLGLKSLCNNVTYSHLVACLSCHSVAKLCICGYDEPLGDSLLGIVDLLGFDCRALTWIEF